MPSLAVQDRRPFGPRASPAGLKITEGARGSRAYRARTSIEPARLGGNHNSDAPRPALLKAGQRVVTVDLDGRQRTLTHYVESRRGWARRSRVDIELPTHFSIARVEGALVE